MSLTVEDKLQMSLDDIIRAQGVNGHIKTEGKVTPNKPGIMKTSGPLIVPSTRLPMFHYEPSNQKIDRYPSNEINQNAPLSLSEEIAASRRELAPDPQRFSRRNYFHNNYNRPHPYRAKNNFRGYDDQFSYGNFNNFRGNYRYTPLTQSSLHNFNRSLNNNDGGRRHRSSSVCSNRSVGSNRSFASNRSGGSNYSSRSYRSNRSNHSNRSNQSWRSNHSFRHYHHRRGHYSRKWSWKSHPFNNPMNVGLNHEVQEKIREMQGQDSGRTPMCKQEINNLESFTPPCFRTTLTTSSRFLSYLSV